MPNMNPERVSESVAVVFRKGNHFLVPPEPLALPYEERFATESFESAAYRLAADHGVRRARIDMPLSIPAMVDAPNRAFVLTDTVGQLDESEFYHHEVELIDRVREHPTLRPVDVALFEQAVRAHRYKQLVRTQNIPRRAS